MFKFTRTCSLVFHVFFAEVNVSFHIHIVFRGNSRYSSSKKNIEEMAEMLKTRQVRNIVVMAGAGISTASGIPDFR